MAFTVVGSFEGVAYTVSLDDAGGLSGSPRVVSALRAADGQQVLATPTGPAYEVTPGDPVSTWAWLARRTRVVETGGDVPTIVPPRRLGTIY